MTISATNLASAVDGLLEAALLGDDWNEPFARFARAAGADGATLVRDEPTGRLRPRLHNEFVLATESIAGPVADYLNGLAPPDPRTSRVFPKFGEGFITDLDQFTMDEIRMSPFYEDFLWARRMRWHACAVVDDSNELGALFLSLKRFIHQDHYEPAEIGQINAALPRVRMAAAISRAVLRAESRGIGRALGQRGEAVIELDGRGRVIGLSAAAIELIGQDVNLAGGRLVAPLPQDNQRLERAIAAPLDDPPRVACVILPSDTPGRRLVLRTMPVVGAGRDVFGVAAALAMLTVWEKPDTPPVGLVAALREAFDLTAAEARVAALIGLGVTLADAARILAITAGTARNYLKAAQQKTGLSRQVELAAVVALMQA